MNTHPHIHTRGHTLIHRAVNPPHWTEGLHVNSESECECGPGFLPESAGSEVGVAVGVPVVSP